MSSTFFTLFTRWSTLKREFVRIAPARLVLAALVAFVAVPVLAQPSDEATTEAQADARAESPAAAASESDTDGESAEATADHQADSDEDYEWFTDDKGQRYRIGEIPKVARTFSRPREGWVRFPGGATFLLEKESDDTFYVRVYNRTRPEERPVRRKEPTPAEVAEVEGRYDFEIEQVDRLALEAFDAGLPNRGQWRDGFDLADMNGDGHVDIVFGPARKSSRSPVIFLGDGAGHWRPWTEATFESAAYDYGDAIVGDWNNDGNLDIALGVHLRGVLALVGDGKGNFKLSTKGIDFDVPGSKTALSAFSSKSLAAVDWNGDGLTDILALGEGPKRNTGNPNEVVQGSVGVQVFLRQENGTWKAVRLSPPRDRNFGSGFALLDVNEDGRQDVVTATSQLGNSWLVLESTSPETAEIAQLEGLPERAVIDTVRKGDFNQDGREDLVLTYRANVLGKWRAGIDVMLHTESGWERHGVLSLLQREPFRAIAVGHLDKDGKLDVAALDDFGVVRILLGEGDGSFVEELVVETPGARIGCQGYDVEVRDLDGDGYGDLVAAFAGEPQGMAAFTGTNVAGCVGGGRLAAWRVVAKPDEPEG